jgi:hypothetical protein
MGRVISFVGASAIVLAMLAMSAAGCAQMNQMTGGVTSPSTSFASRLPTTGYSGIAPMPKGTAEQPPPAIQNCALVAISTPSRWACGGKTYTAYQLARARMNWEKKYGATAQ